MPQITSATLKQAVADSLQLKSVTLLGSQWDGICAMAVEDAYRDIILIMAGKGYTPAQVDASGRLTSMHRLQSLYWAFTHGAGMHNFDTKWVDKLDQRETWKDDRFVLDDTTGVLQATGNPGGVEFHRFDTTNDKWTRDTPI